MFDILYVFFIFRTLHHFLGAICISLFSLYIFEFPIKFIIILYLLYIYILSNSYHKRVASLCANHTVCLHISVFYVIISGNIENISVSTVHHCRCYFGIFFPMILRMNGIHSLASQRYALRPLLSEIQGCYCPYIIRGLIIGLQRHWEKCPSLAIVSEIPDCFFFTRSVREKKNDEKISSVLEGIFKELIYASLMIA